MKHDLFRKSGSRNFPDLLAAQIVTEAMAQPTFFRAPRSSTLAELAASTGVVLVDPSRADQAVRGLASLDEAGPMHLAFFDNLKYVDQLAATKDSAILCSALFT